MNANYQNNIIDHRDYNIENKYNLKLEIDKEYIYFKITKLNQPLENIYTNRMELQTILKQLDLNSFNHSNSELTIFDKIYKMSNISIEINDEDSCNLIVKIIDKLEDKEKIVKIELSKEYMNDNDKLNIYNKEIEEMKKKINKLSMKLNKREEDIKYISKQNNSIIKKINEILLNQENKIKGNNIDEIINKRINEIEMKLFS